MRRALIAALVLMAGIAEPAAAFSPGAPRHVRTARPADAKPRTAALAEDWMLHLVDPHSIAHAGLRVYRSPDEGRGVRFELRHGGQNYVADDITYAPAIAWTRPGWTIRFSSAGAEGEIRLAGAHPGVTAGTWRLGREAGFAEHVTMSWATPVATARVSGRLRVGTQTVDLRGWRGSLEHRWGTFSKEWRAWDHAGTALVHTRAGSAWMLLGVNRRDFITGPGARDAFWLGLLVHATPSGTSACRPRIVRRRWAVSLEGPVAVGRIGATCGRRRVSFRLIPETFLPGSSFGQLGDESRARARPKGPAWIRYAGHSTR